MRRLNPLAIWCMLALSTAAWAATDPYALPNIPVPSKPAAPTPAPAPAQPKPSAAPEKVNLASFGLSVTAPAGWVRTREPNLDTAAQWIRLSPDNSRAIAVMWINVVGFNSESLPLMHIARELQRNEHLTMSDTPVKCGNEPAVEFTSPPSEKHQAAGGAPAMNLVVGRLALHADYFYRVYYLTPTGDGPRKDFDALCDSIVWSDRVVPSKALVMRSSILAPFPMFNLKMTLLLPDPYRLVSETANKIIYETYDFINRNTEAQVTITYGNAHNATMAILEKSISEETAKLGVTTPPVWNNPRLTVGYTWLNQRKPGADGKPVGPDQFIVAKTNDGFFVLLQFDYPPNSDAQSYAAMAPDIVKGFAEPKLLVIPGK